MTDPKGHWIRLAGGIILGAVAPAARKVRLTAEANFLDRSILGEGGWRQKSKRAVRDRTCPEVRGRLFRDDNVHFV